VSGDDDTASSEDAMISILLNPSHMSKAVIILPASSFNLLDHYLLVSQNVGRTPV